MRVGIKTALNKLGIQYSQEQVIGYVIPQLISEGFVTEEVEKKDVVLSRKAFYYAVEIIGEPSTKFNMASYNDVEDISYGILQKLCLNGRINIDELSTGGYGGETKNQVLEYLLKERLIVFDDGQMAEITDKGKIQLLKRL